MREPRKDLPRGLVLGVCGVIILYVSVNFVCVRALGPAGLAATTTPASAVMRLALGETGAKWIAAGIAISALGFLSQSILTAPRVYFAMASDGLFFRAVARLSRETRVPVVAIALQGLWAIVIALSGRYEQILNFFIAMDVLFIGLSATCIFVFRHRGTEDRVAERASVNAGKSLDAGEIRLTPGHPFTTFGFIAACWLVVAATFYRYPHDSLIGLGIALLGLPVFYFSAAASRRKMVSSQ
ncbi:MAG TPA: amino acid permease, partial [Candidatus Acidoferrales bacterium]|nr:amino acid permease [Candidatus Acidoferrales bacterium]